MHTYLSKQKKRCLHVVAAALIVAVSTSVQAMGTLYTIDAADRELMSIDMATGLASTVLPDLAFGTWSGLSAAPNDSNIIYAVFNNRPATLDDLSFTSLAVIDLAEGTAEPFPFFESDDLGTSDIFAGGVAVSSLDPTTAWFVGTDRSIPPNPLLWSVDVSDGSVIMQTQPLNNVRRVEAITFDSNGTLYGSNQDGELITIDLESGDATTVGDPNLTSFITGLAFDEKGQLFATDGLRQDILVTLSPEDGSLVEKVGPLGIIGPEGLAFVAQPMSNRRQRTRPEDGLANDCNDDGSVTFDDLDCGNAVGSTDALLAELSLMPGDLDGTNGVRFADFIILAANFGLEKGKYTEGDIDGNGRVEFADFRVLAMNFGRTTPPSAALAAVPEPTATSLVALAGIALVFCYRSLPSPARASR